MKTRGNHGNLGKIDLKTNKTRAAKERQRVATFWLNFFDDVNRAVAQKQAANPTAGPQGATSGQLPGSKESGSR